MELSHEEGEEHEHEHEGDTTRPEIFLTAPAAGDTLHIGEDHGVHFDAVFSDNEMLASYKIHIHPDFDGHTPAGETSETVDFEFDKSWTLSGTRAAIHHHEIKIPENTTPGTYHLTIYCTDAAGNESSLTIHVALSHEEGEEHEHEHEHEHE
ncbi:MAG: DUF4625 domain-containing protein [Tannerella sp.]|nr:DUF4625 domain-containing protein [Tannerella sp.]